MEIFTKKSLVLKIVIALVIVILFNFSAPTISQASIGGTLLEPIVDLLIAIGDGAMLVIQSILFGLNYSVIKLTDSPPGTIFDSILQAGANIINWGANLVDGVTGLIGINTNISSITESWIPDTFYLPIYVISPEEIFQNKIGLLDVNFFNPNSYDAIETINNDTTNEQKSTAAELQSVISSWYLTLRNFAIVVLLIVLLYTGIRIVTSSAAQDRAKYKEKLFSWIVAMCLLFFMHYIMSFAITIVESMSEGINKLNSNVATGLSGLDGYSIEVKDENGENVYVNAPSFFSENGLVSDNGGYVWPTNLLGTVRIQMQLEPDGLSEDNIVLRKMGYTILYLILVFYTVAFLVVYIKRTIMIAFLTMIAPLVAMTYPIDKMNDGNAQAFNMWLKEYVFNLLIQPFHLILYTMLVGSAIEFAQNNIIYAIVAIGFIFQAEKILRKFFGFNKAETLDNNGSAIGGMLAMAGINQLKKLGSGKRGGKSGGDNKGNQKDSQRIRTADKGKSASERLDQVQQDNQNHQENTQQRNNDRQNINDQQNDEDKTPQQRMLDAYDENIGTDEWDPQERDALAREAYADENAQSGMSYTRDEYEQILRDSGYDENEIRSMVREAYGTEGNSNGNDNEVPSETENDRVPEENNQPAPVRLINRMRNQSNRTNRPRIPSPIKGVMGVAGKGLKYAIPKAGKLYAKTALGLTAGAIGVAAGLASDNDMNILKYGGAGLVGGIAAGGALTGMAGRAGNAIESTVENVASTYTIAAHGQEAEKARLQAKEDKAAMKDKDRQKMYMEKLNVSKKQIKDVMKEAQEYRESGITDDKLIIKAMKAEGFGEGRANNERIILAGLANEVGNDNKKIKDLQSRLSERGLSEPDVKKYIDGIRDITGAV